MQFQPPFDNYLVLQNSSNYEVHKLHDVILIGAILTKVAIKPEITI